MHRYRTGPFHHAHPFLAGWAAGRTAAVMSSLSSHARAGCRLPLSLGGLAYADFNDSPAPRTAPRDSVASRAAVVGIGRVLEMEAYMTTSARRRMRIRQTHARHCFQATLAIKAVIGIPLRTSEERNQGNMAPPWRNQTTRVQCVLRR